MCQSFLKARSLGGYALTVKVIDSSILAKYLLKEAGWRKIAEVLREKPITLDLALKETTNVLWKRVILLRDIEMSM